jgi:phospholipid/cholesterol/gamma-HCH transport system substrate-binding protein
MNRRIPPLGALMLAVAVAVGAALFIYLSGRFGGPSVRFGRLYEISAVLPDSKELADRSDVLERGVHVGQIETIVQRGDRAYVTFSLAAPYAPIHRGATIQVAEKTLLGESFIALRPGSRQAPTLPSGTTLAPAQVLPASVEIDQALNAFDPSAIASLKGVLRSTARGAASPATPDEVAATLAQLPQLTTELRLLGRTLQGQSGEIASGVVDTHAVLSQLGVRQQELASIISGSRATLAALAEREGALRRGLAALPILLGTARRTLGDARPLLVEARPLLADLRTAGPPLAVALHELPPVATGASALVTRLPGFNGVTIPFLRSLEPVLGTLTPTGQALGPAVRNLVPIADYLSARKNTFTAWFANTTAISQQGDSKGKFARFFLFVEPGTAFGAKGGDFNVNAYTAPNDALNNQAGTPYPHLQAYYPGSPRRR